MLAIPDLQQILVAAFMDVSGYNDTNHPAVQLVDIFITEHPNILTFTRYIGLWMILNVLTVLFAIRLSVKLMGLAINTTVFVSVFAWGLILKGVTLVMGNTGGEKKDNEKKQCKGRAEARKQKPERQAEGENDIIEREQLDVSIPLRGLPGLEGTEVPEQQAAATAAVDPWAHKRKVVYEWDTSDDEASIIPSY